MTYMQDLEHELHKRLESFAAGDISAADIIAFVKKTVLESYHNGQNAEPRPAPQRNSQDTTAALCCVHQIQISPSPPFKNVTGTIEAVGEPLNLRWKQRGGENGTMQPTLHLTHCRRSSALCASGSVTGV